MYFLFYDFIDAFYVTLAGTQIEVKNTNKRGIVTSVAIPYKTYRSETGKTLLLCQINFSRTSIITERFNVYDSRIANYSA